MRLAGTRFGELEIDETQAISFPRGLIGFGDLRRFILLEPRGRVRVAWLQSLETPLLAFPVVDGTMFGPSYPEPRAADLARDAGLGVKELAVLVVVAAKGAEGLVANLLAPVIVDLEARSGAQVVLDYRRFSSAAPLHGGTTAPSPPSPADPSRR